MRQVIHSMLDILQSTGTHNAYICIHIHTSRSTKVYIIVFIKCQSTQFTLKYTSTFLCTMCTKYNIMVYILYCTATQNAYIYIIYMHTYIYTSTRKHNIVYNCCIYKMLDYIVYTQIHIVHIVYKHFLVYKHVSAKLNHYKSSKY